MICFFTDSLSWCSVGPGGCVVVVVVAMVVVVLVVVVEVVVATVVLGAAAFDPQPARTTSPIGTRATHQCHAT